MCVCSSCFSCIQLFVTLWSVACQAPLSTGFSKQEYWSGLPCLLPGGLPDPGIETVSVYVSCIAGDSLPNEPLGKPRYVYLQLIQFIVQQKITQRCKAIILQLKIYKYSIQVSVLFLLYILKKHINMYVCNHSIIKIFKLVTTAPNFHVCLQSVLLLPVLSSVESLSHVRLFVIP